MKSAVEVQIIRDELGRRVGEVALQDGRARGVCRHWNSDGILILEAEMADGEYHGRYRSWWGNGKPKEDGVFRFWQARWFISLVRQRWNTAERRRLWRSIGGFLKVFVL